MFSVDFKNTPCHPVGFKFKETAVLHCLDLQVDPNCTFFYKFICSPMCKRFTSTANKPQFVYCITLSLDGSGVGLANVSLIQ